MERKQSLTVTTLLCLHRILVFIAYFVCLFCNAYTKQEDLTFSGFICKQHIFLLYLSREGTEEGPAICSSPISASSPFLAMGSYLALLSSQGFEKSKLNPWPLPSILSTSVFCLCTKVSWKQAKIGFGVKENPKENPKKALHYKITTILFFSFLFFTFPTRKKFVQLLLPRR